MEASSTPQKNTGTLYYVLAVKVADDGSLEHYEPLGTARATSDKAAIRQVAMESGTYLAIPKRSFKPVGVTISQQTVVKLG